jgi:hypothetical protein
MSFKFKQTLYSDQTQSQTSTVTTSVQIDNGVYTVRHECQQSRIYNNNNKILI